MSASQRTTKDSNSRPPRLQPSPSLPNLRARNVSSESHLSRPQPTMLKSSLQIPSPSPADLSSKIPFKEGDLHPNKRSRQQSKNQHYLTPPLTPASSLKSDSTDPDPTDLSVPNEEQVPSASRKPATRDVGQSRFLIIGNIPNDLSEDVIGPYFHSLAASTEDSSSSARPGSSGSQSDLSTGTGNVIQTIYYRFQEKRAIVLAFYDARDADKVKRLIEAKGSQPHYDLMGKDKQRIFYERSPGSPWVEALTSLFVTPNHFLKLLGQPASAAMTRTEGAFCISVGGMMAGRDHDRSGWSRLRFFVPVKLKSVLAKYGELKSFRLVKEDEDNCSQLFMIEYYDIRAGESAWDSLNGRVVDNMKLQLIQRDVLRDECSGFQDLEKEEMTGPEGHLGREHAAEPNTPTASTYLSQSQAIANSNDTPFPLLNDVDSCDHRYDRERPNCDSLDSDSAVNGYTASIPERQKPSFQYPLDSHGPIPNQTFPVEPPHIRGGPFAPDQFGRRGSNNLFFDAVRPRGPYKRVDADHMRTSSTVTNGYDRPQVSPFVADGINGGATDLYSTSYQSAQPHYAHDYFTQTERYPADASVQPPWVSSPPAHGSVPIQYPLPPQSPLPPMCSSMYWDSLTGSWVAWATPNLVAEQWSGFPPPYYAGPATHPVPYPYPPQPSPPTAVHSYTPTSHRTYPAAYPASPRASPENNQLDIRRIEQGLDTRTTVMIKNIPNKMTDKELIAYINKICLRRIDFLYLRMDFQNGCNVGYAFVNFIKVEDLLRFAKMALGEKWNLYSSEKVLQMSYANYQGKEALVEKFKNSCIMDEREEWRPKIFHSEAGPKQGFPEEFPKPTHMRRKERSSYNRGALFVPGTNGGTGHHKTFLNATPSHQRNSSNRPPPAPQGDERRQRKPNHAGLVHSATDVQ